ncbi:MAG TPA: hypothetical protein VGH29_12570 [Candidatus Binataceae bacterium]
MEEKLATVEPLVNGRLAFELPPGAEPLRVRELKTPAFPTDSVIDAMVTVAPAGTPLAATVIVPPLAKFEPAERL